MIHYRRVYRAYGYYDETFTALCGVVAKTEDSSDNLNEITCGTCVEVVTHARLEEVFNDAKLRARRGLKDVKELAEQINDVIKVDRRRQKREALEHEEPTPPHRDTYVGLGADLAGINDSVFAEAERYATKWNSVDCDEWTHELQLTPHVTKPSY